MLSLDGGGVRGLYSARILERIMEKCPNLLDNIDMIAGSSTGGLIAILLGMGYSATSVVQVYRTSSYRIFSRSFVRLYNPFLSRYRGVSKYSVFHHLIGDLRLKDIPRYVVITAYCCDGIGDTRGIHRTFYQSRRGWRPSLFTNLPRGKGRVDPDDDLLVCDAAMRTTAAPTYFPVYQGYCDGSIFANNPSLSAIARVLSSMPDTVSIDSIVCLSLGTGSADTAIPGKFHDWGLMQWAGWLVDLLFDSTNSSIDMNMHLLLGDRYMRINDSLPRAIELDDTTSMDELLAAADTVNINEAINWCHRYIIEDSPTRVRSQSLVVPRRARSFDVSSTT